MAAALEPRCRTSLFMVVAAGAVVALSACGGTASTPAGPTTGTLNGRWSGAVGGAVVEIDLVQQGETVSGTGAITAGTDRATMTVSGSYRAPRLSFTVSTAGSSASAGFAGAVFDGAVQSDRNAAVGILTAPSTGPRQLTLVRLTPEGGGGGY